ncbi:MAG: SpoIID/LytB domain-containing protein [Candidatus Omnitrophota bacterium]
MKIFLRVSTIVAFVVCSCAVRSPRSCAGEPPAIAVRVLVEEKAKTIYLYIKGRYTIYDFYSDEVIMRGRSVRCDIVPVEGGIGIGKRELGSAGLRIVAYGGSHIFLNKKRFRGEIVVLKAEDGTLSAVNYIDLDHYLYGVMYQEASHHWPMESLKAQAVAARTFALFSKIAGRLNDYDLTSDIYSQQYGGRASEKHATNKAVNLTEGEVLAYHGEIFPAYYHVTCAGQTENALNVWGEDYVPLQGVRCIFCEQSPHYAWRKSIRLSEIEKKLNGAGQKIEELRSIGAASKYTSGRVDNVELKSSDNVTIMVKAKDFRDLMGPNVIRSAHFDVAVSGAQAVFRGKGWGHGVGLCQWGAYEMAKKGLNKEDILKYYYPESKIVSVDSIRDRL